MKLLAIHANNALLRRNFVNAYQFLAQESYRMKSFEELDEKYRAQKAKGPLLLKEVFTLVTKGLTPVVLRKNCHKFWDEFQGDEVMERLKIIRKKYAKIFVFTSYPIYVFDALKEAELVDQVFGVEELVENGIITGIKKIELEHETWVKNKFEELGIKDHFTLEPNRYGLLGVLIDAMKKNNLTKEDVDVVGKDITAEPLHLISRHKYKDLRRII